MNNLCINKSLLKKFYLDNYKIVTPHFNNGSKKLLVVSDIHFHRNVDKNIFNLLIQNCQLLKPDFILIPGDIIETDDFITNISEREYLEFFIKELSLICPVIIIPGNHDIGSFKSLKDRVAMENGSNTNTSLEAIKYFESWNRFNNVYFLNNQQTEISGINFLGFSPSIITYIKNNDQEVRDIFVEDYLKSGLKMYENTYNVMLSHSPTLLVDDNVKLALNEVNELSDLVVTGHLHDGYLPKKLDRFYENTNYGIFITPFVSPLKGLVCRGIHDYGRGYLFVSQGFRKFTADIPLFRSLEKITANDVEMLDISNSDNVKEYKKIK